MFPRIWILVLAGTVAAQAPVVDPDSDGDGLSDFQEIHKYLTDPRKKDTDADGVLDGEWKARREHAYTIRSITRVMRPVDVAAMNDDFQDARELDSTPEYVELEVIHYPFSTANDGMVSNPRWREETRGMREWLDPGPTANWDEKMQRDILAALGDIGSLSDKQLVEKAVPWVLRHAEYEAAGFTTFVTAFEGNRPSIPADIREKVAEDCREIGRTIEAQWNHDLFAKSMFEKGTRGSCTSTAIYLTGCLRALGIPTRIVLCIPVVDASDDRQIRWVRNNISVPQVRRTILAGLEPLRGKWASHTFNEVFVGGRWRRLNEDRLGQPILDDKYLGLMTHVDTFHDWADANAAQTIGRRQTKMKWNDAFGGPNPYTALTVGDHVGVNCKIQSPESR